MQRFTDLDHLLASEEEGYYAADCFLDAEELIEGFSEADLPSLTSAWANRPLQWQLRFAHASSRIQREVLQPLLIEALSEQAHPQPVLELMTRLPEKAEASSLAEALVEFASRVWHEHPELKRQVQMSSWSCGLSKRVRERIGVSSWGEAGL